MKNKSLFLLLLIVLFSMVLIGCSEDSHDKIHIKRLDEYTNQSDESDIAHETKDANNVETEKEPDPTETTGNGSDANIETDNISNDEFIWLENVKICGYGFSSINKDKIIATIYISDSESEMSYTEYIYSGNEGCPLCHTFSDCDYIKIDIAYKEENNERVIQNYKITILDTGEDVSDCTLAQLAEKAGFYVEDGHYSDIMTVASISDEQGVSFDSDESLYREVTFINSKNRSCEFDVQFVDDENDPINRLVVGEKYLVEFDYDSSGFGDFENIVITDLN